MRAVPTYGRLQLQGDRWVLSEVPPNVAIRLKSIFASIPKTQTKAFDLPASDQTSADISWFCSRYPMSMSAVDRAELERRRALFEDDRSQIESILLPDWKPTGGLHGFRAGYAPNQMQRQAIELVHKTRRLLLGDEMGQGKSWSAMGALVGSPYLPAALIVPANLPTQWVEEYLKPYTYLSSHIIRGTKPYKLPPANIYVFRYTNIHGWVDIAATGFFKAVVFDEIHELRHGYSQDGRPGEGTQKGNAAKVFADNAQLKLGLSGTPVLGYGSEIWNVMSFLDPDVLGDWWDFVREWCHRKGNHWVVTDPDALGAYLREARVFLRRVREGRPVNTIPIEVGFDEAVAEDAERLARALAMKVMRGSFVEAGQAARELDAFARLQTGLAKADSVAAYVRMLIEASGEQIILAGWHRQVYARWLHLLADLKPILYTGSETARQKEQAKRAFIDRKANPLIISLRSGVGLDGLQKVCSTVVVGEFDWSAGITSQLIGRIDRPGQPKDEVTAIFPYVNFGSDPTIMAVNAIKKDQARGINDPGAAMPAVYTNESRIKMLAEAFLEGSA